MSKIKVTGAAMEIDPKRHVLEVTSSAELVVGNMDIGSRRIKVEEENKINEKEDMNIKMDGVDIKREFVDTKKVDKEDREEDEKQDKEKTDKMPEDEMLTW